jgi:dihydrofolate synthase/folylpolyglutamate synthase
MRHDGAVGGARSDPSAANAEGPVVSARDASEILGELEVFGVRLGLESTRTLLAALGEPQSRYRVVLIGGTNGKGSTSSLLASILHAAGLRVGLYTSPHLEEVAERIRVAGRVIGGEQLATRLERVVAAGRETLGHPPTYFEALTVAAYWHFAEEAIDVAVMEVGLGGRLDATNAAEPVLSIVTGISLDHVKVLGSTLESIAREKAGILRAGRTALHGVEPASARAALEEEARRKGAVLLDAGRLASIEDVERDDPMRTLIMRTPTAERRLTVGMRGAYQSRNVRLAVLAAEVLALEQGLAIDGRAIERGVRDWRWPGRCELVTLPDGREVLLDAAHNEEGIASLRDELRTGWPGDPAKRSAPWRLVFGALDDKPAAAMVTAIAAAAGPSPVGAAGAGPSPVGVGGAGPSPVGVGGAASVILVKPPSPRGVDPRELQSALSDRDSVIAADPRAALDLALAPGCDRVVVCGSIYLVGFLRGELRRRFGVPAPATDPWAEAIDPLGSRSNGSSVGALASS